MPVEKSHVQNLVNSLTFKCVRVGSSTTTVCYAYLPNGFRVGHGDSACVDPDDYDYAEGCKYAKERAIQDATNKIWELEGYLLAVTGATSDKFEQDVEPASRILSPCESPAMLAFILESRKKSFVNLLTGSLQQETWQDRVEKELFELRQKLDALIVFIETDKYDALEHAQKVMLYEQKLTMEKYASILEARLIEQLS